MTYFFIDHTTFTGTAGSALEGVRQPLTQKPGDGDSPLKFVSGGDWLNQTLG